MDAAEVRTGGRPRDEAIDERILDEAMIEFARRGLEGFNLGAVARRAGVAKNSIYLRWPHREDLVRAALLRAHTFDELQQTGDLAADLTHLAHVLAAFFATDGGLASSYQLWVAMQADPELATWGAEQIARPVQKFAEQVIASAQERGEANPAADPVVLSRLLIGGIQSEAVLPPSGQLPPGFLDAVVQSILKLATSP